MEKKRIVILGSTGSIGSQALEVIEACNRENEEKGEIFEIVGMSCGRNVGLFRKQIQQFRPKYICVEKEADVRYVEDIVKNKNNIYYGESGLESLCEIGNIDLVLVAVSGKVGLCPTLKAIEKKIDIALANKETLVMAGNIVLERAKANGVKILPVDSEHSAIFQCIKDDIEYVDKLIITASGGPFSDKTIDDIKKASIQDTLNHPKWKMGRKITVDSATLMNKGLEVIEAHHLFGIDYENIEVVVHKESVIHSAVQFKDGSVIAQIGYPSMHIPIQYALSFPNRIKGIKTNSFDFTAIGTMKFEKPDLNKFQALKLAFDVAKLGKTFPLALNAANEQCVFAFLNGRISLYDIVSIVKKTLQSYQPIDNPTVEQIFQEDLKVRNIADSIINSFMS